MPEILLGYSRTTSVFALYLQALLLRAGFWGQRWHSSSVMFQEENAYEQDGLMDPKLKACLVRWPTHPHSTAIIWTCFQVFHVIFTEHSAGVLFICNQIRRWPCLSHGSLMRTKWLETGEPKSHTWPQEPQNVPCYIIDCKPQELAKPLVTRILTRIWTWRLGLYANSTGDLLLPDEVMAGKKAWQIYKNMGTSACSAIAAVLPEYNDTIVPVWWSLPNALALECPSYQENHFFNGSCKTDQAHDLHKMVALLGWAPSAASAPRNSWVSHSLREIAQSTICCCHCVECASLHVNMYWHIILYTHTYFILLAHLGIHYCHGSI